MKRFLALTTICLALSVAAKITPANADDAVESVDDSETISASPKPGWEELPQEEQHSTARKILLWFPNRVLDFIDIFRLDVGVGPAVGGVVRLTRYGQVGYRQMLPGSLRVGLMGRRLPIMFEHSNELGAGPLFAQSSERKVCVAEVGLGADLLIAGAYGGICLDEAVDFVGGIFTLDPEDDDLH